MIRRLRLASGQVLWFYIACHFLNHAVSLISLGMALRQGAFAVHLARSAWILRACFSESANWPNAPA